MAEYRISGIWRSEGAKGVISHYAFHLYDSKENTVAKAVKVTKARAVEVLSNSQNSAKTMMWNYAEAEWHNGEDVHVVERQYLRSNHDGKVSDNLGHLVNYGLVTTDVLQ